MASLRYKKIFAIRFLAYLSVMLGILGFLFEFGPVAISEITFRKNQLLGVQHTLDPTVITSVSQDPTATLVPVPETEGSSTFGDLLNLSSSSIIPVSTEYGIVIEKINANARVIADVDPGDEDAYQRALSMGVAAAMGSTQPGQPGNLYIFSHSVDAPWNIIRFNAIFYLLRELEPNDKVVIFYKGRRYDYIVYDKTIADPKDISFLVNRYDQPVLTLQTCDPPGTLLNRLIVRAKLLGS